MRQQRCGESERNRDVTSIKMMPRTAGLTLLRSRADQTKSFSGRLGEYLQCLGGINCAALLLLVFLLFGYNTIPKVSIICQTFEHM